MPRSIPGRMEKEPVSHAVHIIPAQPLRWAWLRSPAFDWTLIAGTTLLALVSGLAVAADPRLFGPILALDLWLLGYHHVVATFTRLAFDAHSFAEHRFLVTWLPLLVLAGVLLTAVTVGTWALATLYLYWQWFHYARQSYGISQAYRRKATGVDIEDGWSFQVLFYLVPLWGILHRSAQNPPNFLGFDLKVLPVSPLVADLVGWCAMGSVVYWLGLKAVAAWQGRLPVLHTLYVGSHYAVFITGYILIDHIDFGWLVLNVWHNAQYLLFVWLYNNSRFQGRIDERHRLLSILSQRENVVRYVLICLGLSTAIYASLRAGISLLPFAVLPALAVTYQTINFHHYIVDAIIWRRRKKAGGTPQAEPAV